MRLPPPPLPSLFLSSLARPLHLPFPLPFSLPVVHAGTLAAAFGLFYPFSFFLFSLYLSRVLAFFLSFSFVPPLSQSSPSFGNPPILPRRHFVSFTFSRRSPSLSLFFIISGEFLIIESRRGSRTIGSHVDDTYAFLPGVFAIVPNLRPARDS